MNDLTGAALREIGAIARSIQSINDGRYKAHGLQKGQFVFLTRICEQPGIKLGRLAQAARVDKASATKAVQKLEAPGY